MYFRSVYHLQTDNQRKCLSRGQSRHPDGFEKTIPDSLAFAHLEGNSSAHIKASLMGSSANVLVEDGELRPGTWQGVFLCEFDGPRMRNVWMQIVETE